MNVRYSELRAYYSLNSQRDFEDFSEADIRQTVEGSRPGSDRIRIRIRNSFIEPHSIVQSKYFNLISNYKTWIGRPLLRPSGRYRRGHQNYNINYY